MSLPNEVIIQILSNVCEQVIAEADVEYLSPLARINKQWYGCVAHIYRTYVRRIRRNTTEATLTTFLKHHIECRTDPLLEMFLNYNIDAKGRFTHAYFGGSYQSWYVTSANSGTWVSYDGVTEDMR